MRQSVYALAVSATTLFSAVLCVPLKGLAEETRWIELTGSSLGLDAWKPPLGTWYVAGDAKPDPSQPKKVLGVPGTGVIINGPTGKTRNLVSKQEFGDVEIHLEFLIPEGSNAGIKLQGLYEIQILDSSKKKVLSGEDCGGIYPHAELLPKYHHTDHGVAPKVNACKPPGEWQTMDIIFKAPRFDAKGKKTANARFIKVLLNGQVVQDDVDVPSATGHYWRLPESPRGTILLQADHGPVAFRNIRARPLN